MQLVGRILVQQDAGFRLRELRTVVAPGDDADSRRRIVAAKLAELDDRIARATAARTALAHALACPHRGDPGCPTYAGVVAARLAGIPPHRATTIDRRRVPSPTVRGCGS